MSELPLERCFICSEPTDRAGPSDDSMYLGDVGPWCERCYDNATQDFRTELAAANERAESNEKQLVEIANHMGKDALDQSGNSIAAVAIAELTARDAEIEELKEIVDSVQTEADELNTDLCAHLHWRKLRWGVRADGRVIAAFSMKRRAEQFAVLGERDTHPPVVIEVVDMLAAEAARKEQGDAS